MMQPQLQDLLEAGVHFGHQTRRWNPKMRRFIFAERSGIYIIDLQKTLRQLEAAQELVRGGGLKGEAVLFVCTKKQLKNIIQAEAQRCGAYWVTERWLGGTLTNFQTIKKQIKRLKELEQGVAEGEFEHYTKKEQLLFDRERAKLDKYLSGIKNMSRLPGTLFVVDAKKERIAVAEANKLGIAVVAIVDTNADPDLITVPIPGNDDAIRAVSLIAAAVSDVIAEARRQSPLREAVEAGEAVTYSTATGVDEEAGGDLEKAVDVLRKKGAAKADTRAGREASEGLVEAYIHFNGHVGVLVEVNCETDFVARTEDFKQLVRDVALHIASAKPLAVRVEDLPPELVERERKIYEAQAAEEKKPDAVRAKIVEGRLKKFFEDAVLLEQKFVKDDTRTVGDLVKALVAKTGENVRIRRFARFELGGR